MEIKKCPKCSKVKPASGFYTASTKGGLASWCKDCESANAEQRYQQKKLMRKQNPDWVVAETKKCPQCGKVKPASGFCKDFGVKTGLKSWCKDCSNAHKKQRRQEKKLMLQKEGN